MVDAQREFDAAVGEDGKFLSGMPRLFARVEGGACVEREANIVLLVAREESQESTEIRGRVEVFRRNNDFFAGATRRMRARTKFRRASRVGSKATSTHRCSSSTAAHRRIVIALASHLLSMS
jgi:hypothetical protein